MTDEVNVTRERLDKILNLSRKSKAVAEAAQNCQKLLDESRKQGSDCASRLALSFDPSNSPRIHRTRRGTYDGRPVAGKNYTGKRNSGAAFGVYNVGGDGLLEDIDDVYPIKYEDFGES